MALHFNNLLLRWAIGIQDTVRLSPHHNDQFKNMMWLTKLSIVSFQRWFPGAQFMLFYNGSGFEPFVELFENIQPTLSEKLEYIDQSKIMHHFKNPYPFYPSGVWWKWIPFRFDIERDEISIDTDIICIDEPKTWYEWLDSDEQIIVAPERFEDIGANTCGDFHNHPILRDKKPLNCGVVGQRSGCDFSDRFFEIAQSVDFGQTHDSQFITEQGAINVWAYSLGLENIRHYVLDFKKNAWVRDFIYFLNNGVEVETVHAVTWHKKIIYKLKHIFERRVNDESYDNMLFVGDIIASSEEFDFLTKNLIERQLTKKKGDMEYLIHSGSF